MHRAFGTALTILLMSSGLALAACVPVPPPTIEVTTTADVVADDDVTSLREAFAQANASAGDDAIRLADAATYDLTDCDAGALTHATASALTVEDDDGGDKPTIRQTCTDTGIVRSTVAASSLVFSSVELVGGPNSGTTVAGAGINVAGALTLTVSGVSGVDAGPGGTVVEGNGGGPAEVDITLGGSSIHHNTGTGLHLRDGVVRISGAGVTNNVGDGVRLDGRGQRPRLPVGGRGDDRPRDAGRHL